MKVPVEEKFPASADKSKLFQLAFSISDKDGNQVNMDPDYGYLKASKLTKSIDKDGVTTFTTTDLATHPCTKAELGLEEVAGTPAKFYPANYKNTDKILTEHAGVLQCFDDDFLQIWGDHDTEVY